MTSYLFFLGRSRELCLSELRTFFPQCVEICTGICRIEEQKISVNGTVFSTPEILHILGGTVKVAEVLGTVAEIDSAQLAKYLLSADNRKLTFGISTYGDVPRVSASTVHDIKTYLETDGRSVRFILPSAGESTLSGVAVVKQHVTELNICKQDSQYVISKTLAVQEFEEWMLRDTNRPYLDKKSGMLPLKVARMVVNIGLGNNASGKTLLDPFCGMGTIPNEAYLRGANAAGSDNQTEVVAKAKANSAASQSKKAGEATLSYFVSDATHISVIIAEKSVDVIVTEPFMGTPKLGLGKVTDPKEIKNIVKGLEKLYIGCLRDWQKVLKPNGMIIMALPEIRLGKTKYFVKNVIDSCEKLGYTTQNGMMPYSRPQAIVRRIFYLFQKT